MYFFVEDDKKAKFYNFIAWKYTIFSNSSLFEPLGRAQIQLCLQGRSQPSYDIALCNGVVSRGAQNGGLCIFEDHTRKNKRKTNASMIFVHCAAFYACLSSRSYHSRCTCRYYIRKWWKTVILIRKTWRSSIWAPCQDKNGAGSGISFVYLWGGN